MSKNERDVVFISTLIVAILVLLALVPFITMIMFGVVHSYWAAIPPLGFFETIGVMVLGHLVTSSSSWTTRG
jgi:hypothetical protein